MEKYIKCRYCAELFNYNNVHTCKSIENYDEGIIYCYSCGKYDCEYSTSQIAKKEKARCKKCVSNNNFKKYAKYDYLSIGTYHSEGQLYNINDLNYILTYNILNFNISGTNNILLKGVNVNHIRQDTFFCNKDLVNYLWYNKDGTEKSEDNFEQPNTPLKLCVFMISNNLLSEEDAEKLINISELLIKYGANKKEAYNYYISRYGKPLKSKKKFHNLFNLLL